MKPQVHIVDDDSEVRASLSFMLHQHGYETRIYADGAEFLKEGALDRGCILLDVQMPEMDGLEMLERLAARGPNLPVIILTGRGGISLAVRAMKLGAVDFLEKPCKADELIKAIEGAFSLADQSQSARQAKADATVKLGSLTPRETQILQGLRSGMANKTIARWLGLSPRTVEAYRANMMAKLAVTRMSHALRIALDGDLPAIDPEGRT